MSVADYLSSPRISAFVGPAVYCGAAYGFGYTMRRWPVDAPLDLVAGIGLSALALASSILESKFDRYSGVVRAVGNAGISSYAHLKGSVAGARSRGFSVVDTFKEKTPSRGLSKGLSDL